MAELFQSELDTGLGKEKQLSVLSTVMYALNLAIVLYYPLVVLATTFRVCRSLGAYDFLAAVRQVPRSPWKMLLQAPGLYLILCALSFFKTRKEIRQFRVRILISAVEILLCAGVVAAMDFYYSGVALLVLADLVHYIRNSVYRTCFAVPLIILFAFGKYEIVFQNTSRVAFSAYLDYYSQSAQSYFTTMESAMLSLNIMLFVFYMVLLFVSQRAENVRIRKLNEQLNDANTRLKEYAVEMERMTEIRERNRLAREIHDTLGHTLTGIIVSADAGLVLFDASPPEAKKRFEIIAKSARDGLEGVRRSIHALRPDTLEKYSLEEALEKLVENFCLTVSVSVCYEQLAGPLEFAPDEEDTLYRIVQEGLTNAVRHGHARQIDVKLTRLGDTVAVSLRDDGEGCADSAKEGFGLRHMRKRLELLGGSLEWGNRDIGDIDREMKSEMKIENGKNGKNAGNGFYITAKFPVREWKEEP